METQVKIQRDLLDTRSSLKVQQRSNQLLSCGYEAQVGFKDARRAETLLAQFCTGYTQQLHPVSLAMCKEKCYDANAYFEHGRDRCQRTRTSRKDLLLYWVKTKQ